ncbi:MAG: PadR family transcriptional regulator [Brachybacterium sp.]|uniref:PadR family transcriptional regulator n=1 Tax=unclassified Brachybacterium TaxID=2623841 RepID=UPI003F93D975
MNLSRIILGLLALAPMTGYDLKRHFDSSVRHFWWADKSQIYRTLATLVAEGYAEVETIPGHGAPDRQEHRLTDAGRHALALWLTSPPEPQPSRHPFLARLFFADELDDGALRTLVADRRTAVTERLAEFEGMRPEIADEAEGNRAGTLRLATLDHGITHARAELRWLDDTERSLP